jgi:hypothetical protein
MSELARVSFRKPVQHEPRLSTPYEPGKRDKRYWTEAEDAVIRKYYPIGGNAACLSHLDAHRTPSGVYQRARDLGLTAPKGMADYKGKMGRIVAPPGFEDALRAFYENGDGRKKGECDAFADGWKLPRWWVGKLAVKLGLVIPHKKEPSWTAAEDALMAKVPLHDPDKCARIFREHGFSRTPTALTVRAKRLNISRRYSATLSATAVARILGIDIKGVTREILAGDLAAVKRPTQRRPQQGGDPWSIERAELRRYIIEQLGRIDFRKVDKFAFVDILVRNGPEATP